MSRLPGADIDKNNNASIVHRHPDSVDGKQVLEDVELWNALAGSGQILRKLVNLPADNPPPAACIS